ncbi:Crinkler (CRN) family protein [Phytophthora nicotianae]|uniref:Crinkler (CRN) family protein n=1 Tax=Phytophthora nicotianae TaxID=4792 RepID=A0A0W8CKY1_PHYNI|nr:Crinkler (CRN) family protein [Phytophthora nicotianae]
MVPTQADFRANFYLDFVSMHIAEAVIDKVHGDSLARVWEFAVVHEVDDSGSTAVVRGKVYELLCHKWFSVHMQRTLHFRSLCSATLDDVTIPKEMEMVRFAALDKLKLAESWTYYRPTSKSFGALDAFIWDGQSKCYGLQMTLNADHGIKAAPLNKFLKWLKEAGDTYQFYFIFVAPSKIATSYRKQSTTTATGAVSKTPGASAKVDQFVAALDVDGGDK